MKRWQFWLGVVITLIFLGWTISGIDLAETWDALVTANLWWLIPGIGVYLLGLLARSWRWAFLLRPIKPVALGDSFRIVTIGLMGNNIFPARLGEVLRAYILRRKTDIPITASLVTVVVERIFDSVVMLAFVILNLPLLNPQDEAASAVIDGILTLARVGIPLFVGALLVFLLTAIFTEQARRLYGAIIDRLLPERFGGMLHNLLDRVMEGLASLRSPLDVAIMFGMTILVWLAETGKFWFVMHGFELSTGFRGLMLTNGVATLATAIPSAPGYIGTYHAAATAALEALGVTNAAVALAFITVIHLSMVLTVTLPGLVFFAREGLTFSEVQRWGKGDGDTNEMTKDTG